MKSKLYCSVYLLLAGSKEIRKKKLNITIVFLLAVGFLKKFDKLSLSDEQFSFVVKGDVECDCGVYL